MWTIDLDGATAYLCDEQGEVHILNVEDPANPSSITIYSPVTQTRAEKVDFSGNLAYFATGGGLFIADISNPALPLENGFYSHSYSMMDVAVSGGLAFVADGYTGYLVLDVTNPAGIELIAAGNLPGDAQRLCSVGNLAFIADRSGGLYIYRYSLPASSRDWSLYN